MECSMGGTEQNAITKQHNYNEDEENYIDCFCFLPDIAVLYGAI